MQIKKLFAAFVLGLGLTLVLVWSLGGSGVLPVARAAGFTVDIFTDENDGSCTDGDCSLRDAIIIANDNGEADTITLGGGVYTLTIGGTNEDAAATGDLDITEDVTIVGLGADQTTVNAGGIDRVFDIRPGAGTVVISGVTVFNGNATTGGGIYNSGSDLMLVNTVIFSNAVSVYAGGVYILNGKGTLIGGQVVSNTGKRGGGVRVYGSSAAFTQTGDSIIAYNVVSGTGFDGSGGGVYVSNSARATLAGGQILSNTASDNGGGVFASSGSVVTLDGAQISGNTAGSGGGVGVDGSGTVLTQTGDSVIAYNVASSGGGVYVRQDGHVTLVGGRVISNTATHSGGGMSVSRGSVTWLGGQVAGNTAGFYGGGMYFSQGTVAMDGGQIVSNTAGRRGGGMYIVSDSAFTQTGASLIAHNAISDTGTDGYGGGVYFGGDRATLEGGQIISNTAVRYGGGVYIGSGDVTLHRGQILSNTALLGGGLYNNGGTLTLLNTTVSGNTATTAYGGLCNNSGTSILTFSTVASNTAASQVGGIRATSAVLLQNSLVAHNAPINCSGTFTSTGHNLDSGTSCGFSATGDITDIVPLIGPLDGDGAHPLLEGSPAIDKGLCLPGVTTDQRGVARPQGDACDIGAYEFGVSYQIYLPLVLRG